MGRFDITRTITLARTLARAGAYAVAIGLLLFSAAPAGAQVDTDLSIGGGVRIGWASDACAAGIAGAIRYNSASSGTVDLCNGSNWITVGPGGGSAAAPDRGIQFNSGGAFGASSNFQYMADGDILLAGTHTGTASVPATGAGTRMFFDVQKSAFRAGGVGGTEWDNASLGSYSVAMGFGTTASGSTSMATGMGSIASGDYTTAMGFGATASGAYSAAIGNTPTASGHSSVALGGYTVASGSTAMALGGQIIASGENSLALGTFVKAGNGVAASGLGDYSMAIGLPAPVFIPAANYPQVTGTSSFGIFMQDQQNRVFSANNTMGLFGGKLVIDPATPATQLTARGVIDVGAATDAVVFPSGTTAQRPVAPVNGMTRYNSTTGKFEAYQAGAWVDMISGPLTFLSLTDTPATYAGSGSYFLKVNPGSTAVEFSNQIVASGAGSAPVGMVLDNLDDVIITAPSNGQSLTYNGTNWVNSAAGGGSALDALSDAKTDYVTDNNLLIGTPADAWAIAVGGKYNVTLGQLAGDSITTGDNNIAIGYNALTTVTTSGFNVAIGKDSQQSTTSGADNVSIGDNTMSANTTGYANIAIGSSAGANNTTGYANTSVGASALLTNVAKRENTAIGYLAMRYADSAAAGSVTYNTAIGAYALQGSATPASNTGTSNTAIGHSALLGNTSGSDNVAVGTLALDVNTTGASNIAIGKNALGANTTASGLVAVGFEALMTTATATGSTAVGYQALKANQSGGIDNTALGYQALILNTTGDYNNAIGRAALESNTTGSANMAIGSSALGNNVSGSNSVAIGVDALTLSSGGNNTAIGYSAGSNITTGTNNIMIGYDVDAVTAAGSNQLNIGNTIYGDLANDYVGIGNTAPSVALDVTGDIEYTGVISDVSDLRLKDNIVELDSALAKIMALNPVSFTMKSDPDKRVEFGFIAQDVEKIFPELVITAKDEQETKSLNYTGMIAPMVQAMQEQQRMLEAQQAQIDLLVKQNAELKAMMEEMRK